MPGPAHRHHAGFTIIELLVAISIIALLMALLLPVIGMVREQVRHQDARSRVAALHQALQAYAAEERRHRFPPQAVDLALRWSPSGAGGVLNQLTDLGLKLDLTALDRRGNPPYTLIDPWRQPYRYQADNDLLAASGAVRPLGCDGVTEPLPSWNAAGVRPWGYVWSSGKDGTADGRGWVYQVDER